MWKPKLVSIFQWNVCCCYSSLVSTSILFDGQNIIKTHLLILPDFTELPFELKSWPAAERKLRLKWTFLDDRSGTVQWVQPAGLGILHLHLHLGLLPGLHQAEADWEGEGLVGGGAAPPAAARPEQQGRRRRHLECSLQGGQVWERCYQGLAGEYLQGWRPNNTITNTNNKSYY